MPINLNQNPSIEVNTSGYTALYSTMSRDTVEHYHDVASLKCITNNNNENEGWLRTVTNESSAGTEYTFSVYLKGNGTVTMRFYDTVSGNQASSVITLTSTWTRYILTRTFGAGSTVRQLTIRTDVKQGITFYSDAIMHTEGSTRWVFFVGTADWTYTGAISFIGSVNRKLLIKRLLEGAISFIGILTSKKVIKKLLEGSISFIGTLQRKLSLHRLLEGAISFIGTILGSRLFRKTLEGSISFIGTLSRKLTFKRTLEGKISFIGTLGIRKLWSKLTRAIASWTKEDRKILEYLFDFSFDDGNWDLSDATISSGVLDITADEGYGQRTPDANWLSGANDDFTIEIDFKQDSTVNYGAEITLILAGDVKWIYFDIQGSANLMEIWYNGTKASQSFVDDTNWHTMKVRRVGTTYYMSIDSGDEISWDYGTARTLEDIKLSMYGCTGDFDNFKYSPVILWSKQTRAIASWTKEVI